MRVAWNWTVCDSHGFALDPTFRLPHPPRDSTSVPDEFSILLLQSVHVLPAGVAHVGRHRTYVTWKSVWQETTIAEVQGEMDEAMKLCGFERQVAAEQWGLSSAQWAFSRKIKECLAGG